MEHMFLEHTHIKDGVTMNEFEYKAEKLPELLFRNFKNEVTVLGCVAATLFLMSRMKVYEFLSFYIFIGLDNADTVARGHHHPEEDEIFHTAEQIHYAVFLAMTLNVFVCRLY